MEVTLLSPTSVKIRGKKTTVLIDPYGLKAKQTAEITLLSQRIAKDEAAPSVDEEKLRIDGPGDYEVGGVKISGYKVGEDNLFVITLDGIDMLIAKSSAIQKAKDVLREFHLALLNTNSIVEQSVITAFNASVLLFYGDKKEENAKLVGAANTTTSNKYVVTKEKLPAEVQVVTLG